jgi:E3 ubiquitin-protein ligase MYCBP2
MKNQAGVEEAETCAEVRPSASYLIDNKVPQAAGSSCDQHNCNKAGGGMASGSLLPSAELQTAHSNARINVCDFNLLHNYFLHMFESSEDTNVLKDKNKKNKKKAKCSKSREKRPLEPLSSLYCSVPEIKISRNASWFAMFASVRRTCLEHQSRAASLLQVAAAAAWQEGGDGPELDGLESGEQARSALPRVVGLGLRAVFDMIRETEASHPAICKRGLQSLLDVLQGLQPEELRDEPESVLETMFTTLLELASRPGAPIAVNGNAEPGQHIRALACSCLLALAVAGGSTGHLLRSTAALLMSPRYTACELVSLPSILASLQRSVHSILIRRTVHPDYMSHGVPVSCLVDTFPVAWTDGAAKEVLRCHSMASDGHHLYLHTTLGLYKVGSGFSGTMRGHVYRHRPDFYPLQPGWLGVAGQSLYYKATEEKRFELVVVDRESLQQVQVVSSLERFPTPHLLLTDGDQVGLVTAAREGDAFTVKFLSTPVVGGPMVSAGELPIKLARKCVELAGSSIIEEGAGPGDHDRSQVDFGVDDEVGSLGTGKEFSLMLTTSGKLYYSGKSSAISQKQPCPPGRWNEVVVSRSGAAPASITHFSVGLDGLHALLVGEDGCVYFTGTSKRGEDADRTDRPRRQPKPSKPKKMSRMEGHTVVTTACNSGTSCIVTKKGELYVFGKDSSHADFNTGLVTDLSGHTVVSVAAGKAHIVVVSSNHEVFTFGMNNKGQCGRDFPSGAGRGESAPSQVEGEEGSDHEAEGELQEPGAGALGPEALCPAGKHKWKHDQCMVCAACGECTGYGSGKQLILSSN